MFLRAKTRRKDGKVHRYWSSAMGDVLGEGDALIQLDKLYRCLDMLLVHKRAMFSFLRARWQCLFDVGFDVPLYDLTSTYLECDPPGHGKRRFGHSRDKRSDCVQAVIALVVTPEGLPLAYEAMAGNTNDNTTLQGFLEKIEHQPQYTFNPRRDRLKLLFPRGLVGGAVRHRRSPSVPAAPSGRWWSPGCGG